MNIHTAQALFDYQNGALLWRGPHRLGKIAGARLGSGYRQIMVAGKNYLAHRLVWLWHGRELPKEVDHINGDKSDNRIENLRAANKSQNMHNVGICARNRSGAKGVFFDKSTSKWRVRLMVGRKIIDLGRHDDLEFAELVAIMAREKYHGAFARHC